MESNIKRGLIIEFIGVVCFSLTLPATSRPVPYFGRRMLDWVGSKGLHTWICKV